MGACAALIGFEAFLRVFISPVEVVLPVIASDSVAGTPVEIRQLQEGVATTHFSAGGAHLTGNAWIEPAHRVVIIGDSYVVARETADEQTMGAWLERIGRSASIPVDVRQYGWRGASPARYVVEGPAVLKRWQPDAVVVPISTIDLDQHVVTGAKPMLSVAHDGSWRVVSDPSDTTTWAPRRRARSVLAEAIESRWAQLWVRAPRALRQLAASWDAQASVTSSSEIDPPLELIPSAVVQSLKHAYGDRLVIAYLAVVRVIGDEHPDPLEVRLLDACRAQSVTCVSLREDMLAARKRGIIARGFQTTTLGSGHLNAEGHRLVATAVWPYVRERLAAAAAAR